MRIVRVSSVARAAVVAACLSAAVPTFAQPRVEEPAQSPEFSFLAAELRLPFEAAEAQSRYPSRAARQPERPAALLPLYGSLIALQGLDIHSTRRGLASGSARELNPAMRPVVRNSAAFIAVKASATAGVIWASEKMWKKHPKRAVIFAAIVNTAIAAVVANNYRVNR
ncbi:MAG TPA: DUF5658 family protein [Vicinamibacterales bacterium]|nr:DUF5658 family protein [Vicinamibacterales bacterium]